MMGIRLDAQTTFIWMITSVMMASSVQGTCTVPTYTFALNTTSPNYCPSGSVVNALTECTYICAESGFSLQGEATTTCRGEGTFSTNPPTCRDIEAPIISCQSNINTTTDPELNYATVIIDDPVVEDNSGDIKLNLPDSYRIYIGISAVRFEAVDDAGNSAACSVLVTVQDTEAPRLTCPGTLNVTNDPGLNYAIVTWEDIEIVDNSGQYLSNRPTYPSGTRFPIGTTTIEVSATDLSSNIGTCSFLIVVRDVEPPTLICAEDFTTNTDPGVYYADVMITPPMIQDNSNPYVNQSEAYPVRLVIGSSAIRFSAEDAAGNSGECTVVVTVRDDEPPMLTCPEDIVVTAPPNHNTTSVSWPLDLPSTTDNSQSPVTTPVSDPASGSTFALGMSSVKYTASDVYGNEGSCTLRVTVLDYDECEEGFDDCNENAACTNIPGGYTCQCNVGYIGDGFECEDIDECTTDDRDCDINADCVNTDGSYECQCKNGYSGDGVACEDINECDTGTSDCHSLAECTNTEGSFTCTCRSGYTGDGTECTNIDECTTDDHGCDINADCVDAVGTFECQCRIGYSGDGMTCADVDECSSVETGCDENAECINTEGSYICQCLTGFSGDGTTCGDIDECTTDDHYCDINADCGNTDGSYECQCKNGYSGDGVACKDINECDTGTSDCHSLAECTNTDGSFTCTCRSGYTGDGTECTNIDECTTDDHGCDINADCVDAVGTFECQCQIGYSGDGMTCADVDECSSDETGCDENAECINTDSSYICQCLTGFSGDGTTCGDIDECTTDDHDCDINADCVNTDGSYECQCQNGYSGDGVACEDINECDTGTSDCHSLAECTNAEGSFTCTCRSGYTGDGTECTNINECTTDDHGCDINADCIDADGTYECQCRTGFSGDGMTCADVDECRSDETGCGENAECINAVGSYICQCLTGFSGDGTTCGDIDECTTEDHDCDINADCVNTDGSYECHCQNGYSGDGVKCEDINECDTGTSGCHSLAECTNTEGSFTCTCRSGYMGDGTECTNIDECTTDDHGCDINADCVDVDGTFECECRNGYSGDGMTCADVDECSSDETGCDENAECINTEGSYICQCLTGFSGDGTTCGAFDICESLTPCPSVADCINEIDTYSCRCRTGYETVSTNDDEPVVCSDVDECSSSTTPCDVNAVCINMAGSYECVCGDGYAGDGKSCEAVDPCLSSPCQNAGICTSEDGTYLCECPPTFTGINCNTAVVQNEPIEVVEHPASQQVEYGARLSLSCAFQNAESFGWKKNDHLLVDNVDRSPLVISPALPRDQGYYSCIGYGPDGNEVETNVAVVTMTGVTNYIVTASFDLTYEDSLADPNSAYFIETAGDIENFVNIGLQNTAGFSSPPEARVDAMTAGSVVAEVIVFVINGTDDELRQLSLVETALVSRARNSDGFMDPDIVSVMSTVTCPVLTWMSPYGAVNFTTGPVNTKGHSTGVCPPYKINYDEPIGRAQCVGDGLSPCYWQPVDNCGRDLTADERLIELEETPVTIDNVADIAETTSELTSSSEALTSDGVASASRLLQDIADAGSPEPAVCSFVIETVQNILSASPDELAGAQTDDGATSRVVASLEEQLFLVDVTNLNGSFRQVADNLAVEVVELSPDTLRSGLAASLTVTQGSDKLAPDAFKLILGKEMVVDEDDGEEPDALIELPTEIGDVISGGDNVRCSFTTFADPALFQSPSLPTVGNQTGSYRAANSPVISATVGRSIINGLIEPVVVSFKPLNSNATNATCVFWDFEANNGTGDWSTDGCRLSNISTDSRPVCECDHLTNFAVLMDIYGGSTLSDKEDYILEILSYVGCSMSIVGLVITIMSYISNKKFRMKNPNQILLCLCFSLLGLYVTFLAMISLDAERGVVEVDVIPCSIVAGLLHFFTLSSLAWMCVEGFNMYLMFVRVVDSYVSNFILKASFCAWGLPAIVVFITAGVTRETYAQTDFCFVSLWPQVGGLLIPIGLILLFNMVVFALVMKRLTKTVQGKQLNEKTERRQRIRRFQNAICILLLMGLTWSIGYLSLIQATSVVVQGIFTVLNSLQGYFIFMLYCVRQPQVRRQWRSQFSCCLPESLRVSLDSSTSRFNSTMNTRTTTTWKPNNQPPKNGVNAIPKFNPNSVPTSTTENLGSRMYQNDKI